MFFSFLLSKWIILFNLHLSRLISLRTDCLFVLVCFHLWYWSMFLSAMMHTVKICFLGSCTKSSSYQYKIYFSITWFLSFIISFNLSITHVLFNKYWVYLILIADTQRMDGDFIMGVHFQKKAHFLMMVAKWAFLQKLNVREHHFLT